MRIFKIFPVVLCAVLLCSRVVPGARADQWDKKTIVIFSDAVEIPGKVLQPGTYVFKVIDSLSNGNIVQIWSEGEDHLVATILTIPDYKPQADDKSIFELEPLSSESTLALRSWFYAGENSGHRFLNPEYPTTEQASNVNSGY